MRKAVNLEDSDQGKDTRNIMTTTLATLAMETHNYWTATALAAIPATSTRQEDESDEHYKHKFGLCHDCGHGLDDESEFTLHTTKKGDTIIVCHDCVYLPLPPWIVEV